jgi:hypothetical protein
MKSSNLDKRKSPATPLLVVGATIAVVALGYWARAAIDPSKSWGSIPFHGRLESGGMAINGPVDVAFSLWDAPTAGNKLWEETQLQLAVNQGDLSARLGVVTGLNSAVGQAQDLHLGIAVKGAGDATFTTLSGRQVLGSVPFALAAKKAIAGQVFSADGLTVNGAASVAGKLTAGSADVAGKFTAGSADVTGTITGAGTSAIWSAVRSGGLFVTTAGMTAVPGMTVSFTLARPATIHTAATGAISLGGPASAGRTCRVGLGFTIDGQLAGDPAVGQAIVEMVDADNDPSVVHKTWAMSRVVTLTAGPHTIEVVAREFGSQRCWVCADTDGSTTNDRGYCQLAVMAFHH